jgi:sulfoxide reductase heme-binding subunit YedZ
MQAWISKNIIEPNRTFNMLSLKQTKVLLFIVCLYPVGSLVWGLFSNQLGANPIETLTRSSGVWALRFLLITLMITPIRWVTGWAAIVRVRRMLGLFAFFYATLHMLLYLGLDQFFNLTDIWIDIVKRPFITIGFICFMLLVPLAITSTNKMMKRLGGRRWKQLHRLSYLIAVLGCLHFYMLVKADHREPIIYALIVTLLLCIRVIYSTRQNHKKIT